MQNTGNSGMQGNTAAVLQVCFHCYVTFVKSDLSLINTDMVVSVLMGLEAVAFLIIWWLKCIEPAQLIFIIKPPTQLKKLSDLKHSDAQAEFSK